MCIKSYCSHQTDTSHAIYGWYCFVHVMSLNVQRSVILLEHIELSRYCALTTIYHGIIKNELNLTPLTFSETPLWGTAPVFTEGLAVANVIRWGEFLQVFNGCSQGQRSHV